MKKLIIKDIFKEGYSLILFSKKDTKKQLKNDYNIELKASVEDVSLINYLVDFSGKETTIEELLLDNFGSEKLSANKLYNLYIKLKEELKEKNLEKLYRDIELPLSDVLFDMEEEGFKVDINDNSLNAHKNEKSKDN